VWDDMKKFIEQRTDTDILAKTHAFKVTAFARKLAYEYTQTPQAKRASIMYPEALEMIEPEIVRLHSKAKALKRRGD